MSRSWREERSTTKVQPKKAPRPRVSDFAREYYQGKGYQVETPEDKPEEPWEGCTAPLCR